MLSVLALDTVLMSITGVGLLLILPLLGLLGFSPSDSDNAMWRSIESAAERVGFTLNLEAGLLLFVAVIGFRALLGWRKTTWQVDVEQGFQMAMRTRLYETLARTEVYHLQRLKTSEFIQSTQTEIRRAQQAANTLFRLFSQALNLGVYFAVALILSWEMTLIAVVCGLMAMLVMLPVVRNAHSLSGQQIRIGSSLLNNIIEHIQGVRTARSLGLTDRFVEEFKARCLQAASVASRLTRLSAHSRLVFELLAVVLLAGIVYVALTVVEVEPTRFVVLLVIFARIFPSIGDFQNEIQLFAGLVPSFSHYSDLLSGLQQHEEGMVPSAHAPRPIMRRSFELRHVSFRYAPESEPVLNDVSMVVEKGRLNAIGGHSGAGKSTLADIATGLLPPQEGGLFIDGAPVGEEGRLLWRRETAVVPQEGFLFDDTIRANLLCVRPDAKEKDLWDVLDAVNARAFVELQPDGLARVVGERGNRLSGGERQRLAIARALLRNPQLLVLDEPTNNLDKESEEALLDLLGELKRQVTLLVISHDYRILDRADRVFRLEDGALLAFDQKPIRRPA